MLKYPPDAEKARINNYELFEKVFLGEHVDAFNIKTQGQYKKELENLRYVAVNFGGMISKLSADMLFEEPPRISAGENDDFIQEVINKNQLKTQFYEAGLENSFRGDAVFRIRAKDKQTIIEDINPSIYFPEYDEWNVRKEPKAHVLAWKVKIGEDEKGKPKFGIFKERHLKGSIEHNLYELENDGTLGAELKVTDYMPDIKPEEKTNVSDFLVIHIPNYRINSMFFGISDYKDLMQLMFAINNRITKVDNILDKHGDPILAVPEGVLDEEGKVSRKSFGVIEVPTSESAGAKPEYIVWDAKLESAFSEIDKLIEFLFITSETSPASLGLDKDGQAESGRALKYKLLRTIAKKHRKELYFDWGIKKMLNMAQEFAFSNKLKAGDVSSKNPENIEIEWQDGIINDAKETLEIEQTKLDNGLTTTKEAIQRLEGVDEKTAEEKVKLIEEENAKNEPKFGANPFEANKNEEK
jgi:hypothetical protein